MGIDEQDDLLSEALQSAGRAATRVEERVNRPKSAPRLVARPPRRWRCWRLPASSWPMMIPGRETLAPLPAF